MDKTGFLKELKQYLAVLNEGEQKDILDEYAQHIDMKMERGMMESEAIKDFGDIEELASEILEAYHVNPRYGARKRVRLRLKEERSSADAVKKGCHHRFWETGTGFLKKMMTKTGARLSGAWRLLKKSLKRMGEAWRNQMEPRWLRRGGGPRQNVDGPMEIRRKKMISDIPGKMAGGIGRLFMTIFYLAVWLIRWGWNVIMMFLSLTAGVLLLGSLFGLGVLTVLLIQGYPLAGLTIGCLGMTLCAGAAAVIPVCLCRFRGREKEGKGAEPNREEVENTSGSEAAVLEVPEHV